MANPEHESRLRQAIASQSADFDFAGCDLSGLRLPSGKLTGYRLGGANLRRADLSGAYLQNADLSHASLTQAKLSLADLRQASLCSASLKSADLNGAVLQGADLSDADLAKCVLTKAMLTDANVTGANLDGADMRGVRGATVDQIRTARNWQEAIFDPPMAQALSIEQDAEIGRHGKALPRSSKQRSIAVDIDCATTQPTFGDLFVICGEAHPRFAPSGNCDLSLLAKLGFQQTDDFFAICTRDGDPIIWLYPLLRGKPAAHHEGPFDGLRLELPRLTKATAPRFLAALAAFTEALGGSLHDVIDDRRGDVTSLADIRTRMDAVLAK